MVKGEMVLMKGVQIINVDKLLGSVDLIGCNITSEVNSTKTRLDSTLSTKTNSIVLRQVNLTMLWHQRMGHIGEKGLQVMHKKGMVEEFPYCNLEVNFCEHCIYGKKKWVRFPSGATMEKGILELIHSDVFGLALVPSIGGSLYYASFIDYFSRKTWIYFLRKK
jgi:hypothetical protein